MAGRPRVIEWTRRGRGDDTVDSDTRERFELRRLIFRGAVKIALYISAKEGGPGLFPAKHADLFDSIPDAKEACRLSTYSKSRITPRADRVKRPYAKREKVIAAAPEITKPARKNAKKEATAEATKLPKARKAAPVAEATSSPRRLRAPAAKTRGAKKKSANVVPFPKQDEALAEAESPEADQVAATA